MIFFILFSSVVIKFMQSRDFATNSVSATHSKPPRLFRDVSIPLILDISVVAFFKQFLPLSSISLFSTIYRRVFGDFAHAVNFIFLRDRFRIKQVGTFVPTCSDARFPAFLIQSVCLGKQHKSNDKQQYQEPHAKILPSQLCAENCHGSVAHKIGYKGNNGRSNGIRTFSEGVHHAKVFAALRSGE